MEFIMLSLKILFILWHISVVTRLTFKIKNTNTITDFISDILIFYALSLMLAWVLYDEIFTINVTWG